MNLQEANAWLLRAAEERGVQLETLSVTESTLTIRAQDGAPTDINISKGGGLGLRVILNGKTGYASTEELTEEALAWALNEAIQNAELQSAAGEAAAALPAGEDLGRFELIDEDLSATLDEKKGAAIALERGITADERVQTVQHAAYRERQQEVAIASTAGARGAYRTGNAALLSMLVMREGESVKQGFEHDARRGFHQLDPGRTALDTLTRVGRHLGARPLTTGRRRAIFEPDVVSTLMALLAYALSGKTLVEGKSRLEGRIGQRVASPLITITDDPTHSEGLGSRPFDSEGTPAAPLTLIEAGVLCSFLHNSQTARRAGHENTGHAERGYRETLGVAPSNLLLAPGAGIEYSEGVIVTDLMGVHAGANPVSGDVSVQAMGLELRGGEREPVEDFAISFNLFELLGRIDQVGDDPEWRAGLTGVVNAPSLSAPDVSFAGS